MSPIPQRVFNKVIHQSNLTAGANRSLDRAISLLGESRMSIDQVITKTLAERYGKVKDILTEGSKGLKIFSISSATGNPPPIPLPGRYRIVQEGLLPSDFPFLCHAGRAVSFPDAA